MKIIRILEISWLVIAIVAFLIGSYLLFNKSNNDALFFYLFTIVASAFYYMRRKQRINITNSKS